MSLHIPSCSLDQPKMCEKHCPHRLCYIIAIDTSKPHLPKEIPS